MKQFGKRFGSAILIVASLFMASSILACGKKKDDKNANQTGDKDLTIKSVTYEGATVDITDKNLYKLSVANGVTTLDKAKFEVKADFADKKDQPVPVAEVKLPDGKSTLEVGKNVCTIKIAAKAGSYKAWEKKIEVTRAAAGQTQPKDCTIKEVKIRGTYYPVAANGEVTITGTAGNITKTDVTHAKVLPAGETVATNTVEVTVDSIDPVTVAVSTTAASIKVVTAATTALKSTNLTFKVKIASQT